MTRFIQLTLLLLLPFGLAPAYQTARAASSSRGSESLLSSLFGLSSFDDSVVLQARLQATDEEWSIIYPKLLRIQDLRAAANISGANASSATSTVPRMFNSPLGGTSMDAPTMTGGRNRRAGRSNPFDPAKAPGAASSGVNILSRTIGRAVVSSVRTGQGNAVETLLSELRTLLEDRTTTDKQLFDKLAAIRAARAKAVRDLDAAQKDLAPLLTTDQLAILISLGLMD